MSVTLDAWSKVKAITTPEQRKKLLPLWNEAMQLVHASATSAAAPSEKKSSSELDVVNSSINVAEIRQQAQLEILERLVNDMKERDQKWTGMLR